MHLAGHTDNGSVLIDTHDGPVCDDVWKIYEIACQRFPKAGTLVEWDEEIPDFPTLEAEILKARMVKSRAVNSPSDLGDFSTVTKSIAKSSPSLIGFDASKPENSLYQTFFEAITTLEKPHEGLRDIFTLNTPTPGLVGLSVYHQAYYLRLKETIGDTYPALKFICGEDGFSALIAEYLTCHPPSTFSVHDAGRNIEIFVRNPAYGFDFGVTETVLGDIAAIEWAMAQSFIAEDSKRSPVKEIQLSEIAPEAWETLRISLVPSTHVIPTEYNVWPAIECARNDEAPEKPCAESKLGYNYLISRNQNCVKVELLEIAEGLLLGHLNQGNELLEACRFVADKLSWELEAVVNLAIPSIASWAKKQIIAELILKS